MEKTSKNANDYRSVVIPSFAHSRPMGEIIQFFLQQKAPETVLDHWTELLGASGTKSPRDHAQNGDTLKLNLTTIARRVTPAPKINVRFENDNLLLIDKPAGLLVHPAGGRFEWTVIDWAKYTYPNCDMDLCHRLDRFTSGVLMLTKQSKANTFYKKRFAQRAIKKEYRAFVRGAPNWSATACDAPIAHARDASRVRRTVHPDGREALTRFHCLRTEEGRAEIACNPITGRSHQIRVHLAHLGLPIIGDRLYGIQQDRADPDEVRQRHALHCERLLFETFEGISLEISAPIHADMQQLWSIEGVNP